MIEIITKGGKKIGKISDDMSQDDIIYVDGKPIPLSDVYNDPELYQKFNDEVQGHANVKKFQDGNTEKS